MDEIYKVITVMLLLTCVSCGPQNGSVPVLIVAPLDERVTHFGLKVVHLPRVIDLAELRGERFIFKAGHSLAFKDYKQILEENDTFTGARVGLLEKVSLTNARPRFSWNGDYYRPVDFDSLYMATAYYWLERVADFFDEVVHDASKATFTPVVVSVYGALTSKGFIKVPSGFIDNSAYLPMEDMFKMYRVADQDGLPYQMNPGVVAHEFHHRVFHELVFESKGKQGYQVWRTLNETQNGLKYARARLLLRAIDEGLADVHAVAFARNADFLSDTQRDLNGDFADKATYDNLADSSIETRFSESCNGESLNFGNPHWRYYCLGTVIAKTIWEAAERDTEKLRADFLPAINRSLSGLSSALIASLETFDVDVLLKNVLVQLPLEFRPKMCSQIKTRFASLLTRIPQCT